MDWEPGLTTPTVVTFLSDTLCHTVTLRPSEKSPGSSHLDVTGHAYTNICRSVSASYQGMTLMKSQRGMWTRLVNDSECLRDFVTFSTYDVQRTGVVRVDISKAGMREYQVLEVNFDEVSGRIFLLAGGLGGGSYGLIVDMPRM